MIKLKLAEYDLKTGKFNEFFDLGLNEPYSFGFYGDTITVYYAWIDESFSYDLDKKDPLNRFNGLFDGLTYGEGRFVLCESIGVKDKNQKDVWAFDIAKLKPFDSKLNYKLISNKKFLFGMGCMDGYVGCDGYGYDFTNVNFSESFNNADLRNEIVANLFENPELYEQIK